LVGPCGGDLKLKYTSVCSYFYNLFILWVLLLSLSLIPSISIFFEKQNTSFFLFSIYPRRLFLKGFPPHVSFESYLFHFIS
jgi:hypothetical protein